MSVVGISSVALPPRRAYVLEEFPPSPTPASGPSQQHRNANIQPHLPAQTAILPTNGSPVLSSSRSDTPLVTLSTSDVNRSWGDLRETKLATVPTLLPASLSSVESTTQSTEATPSDTTGNPQKSHSAACATVGTQSFGQEGVPMEGLISHTDAQHNSTQGSGPDNRHSPSMAALKLIQPEGPEESEMHSDGHDTANLKRPRSPEESHGITAQGQAQQQPSAQYTQPPSNTHSNVSSGPSAQGPPRTFRQQHKGLASLLGPNFEDWKFSEEALVQALHLKAEQERTKQEFYRLENRKKVLELLTAAARAGVPGPAIPSILGGALPSPPPGGASDRLSAAGAAAAVAAATANSSAPISNQIPVPAKPLSTPAGNQRIQLPGVAVAPGVPMPYMTQTGVPPIMTAPQQHPGVDTVGGLGRHLKNSSNRLSTSTLGAPVTSSNTSSPPIQIVNFEDQQSPTRFRPTHARSASAMPFGATRPITQAYYARGSNNSGLMAAPGPLPAPPANNIQFHHWRPDQQTRERTSLSPRREAPRDSHAELSQGHPGPAVLPSDRQDKTPASQAPAASQAAAQAPPPERKFTSTLPDNPHAVKRRSFGGHTRYKSETVLPRFESWYGRNDNEGVSLLANMATERSRHDLGMIMDDDNSRQASVAPGSAIKHESTSQASTQPTSTQQQQQQQQQQDQQQTQTQTQTHQQTQTQTQTHQQTQPQAQQQQQILNHQQPVQQQQQQQQPQAQQRQPPTQLPPPPALSLLQQLQQQQLQQHQLQQHQLQQHQLQQHSQQLQHSEQPIVHPVRDPSQPPQPIEPLSSEPSRPQSAQPQVLQPAIVLNDEATRQ